MNDGGAFEKFLFEESLTQGGRFDILNERN